MIKKIFIPTILVSIIFYSILSVTLRPMCAVVFLESLKYQILPAILTFPLIVGIAKINDFKKIKFSVLFLSGYTLFFLILPSYFLSNGEECKKTRIQLDKIQKSFEKSNN